MLVEIAREFLLEVEQDPELRSIVDRADWNTAELLAIAGDFGYFFDEESLYGAYDELYAMSQMAV